MSLLKRGRKEQVLSKISLSSIIGNVSAQKTLFKKSDMTFVQVGRQRQLSGGSFASTNFRFGSVAGVYDRTSTDRYASHTGLSQPYDGYALFSCQPPRAGGRR
jgi:hypothetical protein